MKEIIATILGGALGGLISLLGFPITSWQWWAVMLLAFSMMMAA